MICRVKFMDIYPYTSRESPIQNFFPTQGCNESYSEFTTRVAGFQLVFEEPDQFLRHMSNDESAFSPTSEFMQSFDYAKPVSYLPPADVAIQRQHYHSPMQPDVAKYDCCRNNQCAPDPLNEPSGGGSCNQKESVTAKKNIFQRILKIVTRCLIPCIKLKK